jgi:hypothetical protein
MTFTAQDAERLRHLYDALRATEALIAGAQDERDRRKWVRHEAGLMKEISPLLRKKTP